MTALRCLQLRSRQSAPGHYPQKFVGQLCAQLSHSQTVGPRLKADLVLGGNGNYLLRPRITDMSGYNDKFRKLKRNVAELWVRPSRLR